MPSDAKARIAIIGVGRLGGHLCRWLTEARYVIAAMSSRDQEMMRKVMALSESSAALFPDPYEAALQAEIIFLTLPDGKVAEVVEDLASRFHDWRGKTFVHCAGAQSIDLLKPLADQGAAIAVMHPLQSFTPLSEETKRSPFQGVTISIESDDAVFRELLAIVEALGARAMRLHASAESRARYHAAAVLASNALVALMDAATQLLAAEGQEPEAAKRALLPLVFGTLANVTKLPLGQALTGPVTRGDAETIRQHLQALPENQRELYRASMHQALELALRAGLLDDAQTAAINAALGEH